MMRKIQNNLNDIYITNEFDIGYFIYCYRISRNITQEELAQLSGLKQPQISRIEQNKNVKVSTVMKVLESLELTIKSDDTPFNFTDNDGKLLIGSLITFKRKTKHLTQATLAVKTKLKQPQIVQIEKNHDITMNTLKKILNEIDLRLKISLSAVEKNI